MDADILMKAHDLVAELLEGQLPQRAQHVRGVCQRAEVLCPLLSSGDAYLLRAAALLHDIGYSPQLRRTGLHALDGAAYLSSIGLPRRLCALVAHHSCAYREAELRGLSVELAEWEDEDSLVRDGLWWADMTTTPDGGATDVQERIEEIQRRYGPEDLVSFFIRQAKTDLVAAVERTTLRLRAAGIDYTVK
ncbi:HD domain-containing protein [Lentzea sp. NPDC006480]|uniref:HD domain-containing protein n=1 Tax=Lentzea sp. NPDC006480 TaxID=3157176 RepID=UPI0033AAAE33